MLTTPRLKINWRVTPSEYLDSDSDMASPVFKSSKSRVSTIDSPIISPRKCPSTPTCYEEE